MSERGSIYWEWVDPLLHCRIHEERLGNGLLIDIHVRLSEAGETQLFVGVYEDHEMALLEEAYLFRPGETMTQASDWGIQRAKDFSDQHDFGNNSPKCEALPRKGSRQAE